VSNSFFCERKILIGIDLKNKEVGDNNNMEENYIKAIKGLVIAQFKSIKNIQAIGKNNQIHNCMKLTLFHDLHNKESSIFQIVTYCWK
jgi:hypothetical protein